MDRIPADGEKATLIYQGYQFDVLETRNKMTEQVRIMKLQEEELVTNSLEDDMKAEKQ